MRLQRLSVFRKRALHLCVLNRNLGDNAINLAIKGMLSEFFRIRHVELLNNLFESKELERLRRADLLILGGGGLIHSYGPRGNPLIRTGTLWNIHLTDLKRMSTPMVVYGVGFNHFYGDPEPLPQMRDLFRILVDKGALIGFRNDGSRSRFLEHFPEFEPHIEEIPDPALFFRPKPLTSQRPYVVLQIAADRPHMRYGGRFDEFIAFVHKLIERIDEEVHLIPHTPDDEILYRQLTNRFRLRVWPLRNRVQDAGRMIGIYAGARFSISTRGHSQICSVGNRVPTFSISTHPKVKGFAEVCGLSRWCYCFQGENSDDGLSKFERFAAEQAQIRDRLDRLNHRFDDQIRRFNQRVAQL
jgi:polysaccharide pyruvyl transferase WcaK-like protein